MNIRLICGLAKRELLSFDRFTHVTNDDVIITKETTNVNRCFGKYEGSLNVSAPAVFDKIDVTFSGGIDLKIVMLLILNNFLIYNI